MAVVQPLTLGVRASLDRLSEPGPSPEILVAWFRSVGRRAGEIAAAWGLTVWRAVPTDRLSLDATVERVLRRVDRALEAGV